MIGASMKKHVTGECSFVPLISAWETAWQEHVQNWNPERAEDYISAFMLNEDNSTRFRTEFEQLRRPYPGNVNVECDSNIWRRINQTLFEQTLTVNITRPDDHEYWNCDILRRRVFNGTTLYTVVVTRPEEKKKKKKKDDDKEPEKHVKLKDIPSMALRYTDRPYTSDMFLEEAFRHSIMIPDSIFPPQWMNYSPASTRKK